MLSPEKKKSNREEALAQRAGTLKLKPEAFKGNSLLRKRLLSFYDALPLKLTSFQKEMILGLLLGDASAEVNAEFNKQRDRLNVRIKMQQSLKPSHKAFLEHTKEFLKEYTGNDGPLQTVVDRAMVEFQTLSCPQFQEVTQLFSAKKLVANTSFKKCIMKEIKPFITPVSVAYWFCGDGGKADYTTNKGKGIFLHTLCFNKEGIDILCEALFENLGLAAKAKSDKKAEQYIIEFPGHCYERFTQIVGPYIIEPMFERYPPPREATSRFGEGNVDFVKRYFSSAFREYENIIEQYPNKELVIECKRDLF
jgi:hypothetical protein